MRKANKAKAQRAQSSGSPSSPGHARPPATASVYLVDDEPLLLDLAEISLEPSGYISRKFLDPTQAWQAFRRAKVKPKLLITDYAMGRMNGLDLIQRCKKADPKLKTILVSGTVGAETVVNAPVTVDRFLAKPYPPERLCALAQEVLC